MHRAPEGHLAQTTSRLANAVMRHYPELPQRQAMHWAGVTGLFCRVAFVDVNISAAEKRQLIAALKIFFGKEHEFRSETLVELGMESIKEWSGIEDHLYCDHLKNELSVEEKRRILDALFCIAGSDGRADNQETEEIKIIARGLLLDDREYFSARARNKDLLGALKDG